MISNENIIAKKYAIAFLNIYDQALSVSDIENLSLLEDFLRKSRYFYVSLQIPSISLSIKKLALEKVSENYQFKKPITLLMYTMLTHGRIEILHKVLGYIRHNYAKRKNIEFFKISTSHALTTAEKKIMVKLIQTLHTATIRTLFKVDQKLIVGARIESHSFLWERSIRKELIKVSKAIAKEGIKC